MSGIFFTERYECNISHFNSLNDVIHELDNSVNLVFLNVCLLAYIYLADMNIEPTTK